MTLLDLLKEGVAIRYFKKDNTICVWTENNDVESIVRISNILTECFDIELKDITISPTSGREMKIRLEFPFHASGEGDEKSGEGDENTQNNSEWIDLTDKAAYCVKDGELVIGWKKGDKIVNALRVPMDTLKKLYDRLPEEATTTDLRRVAAEMELNIIGFESYIIRVLARRAEFGGELVKEGKTLKLIKDTASVRDEVRKKLEQEKEVIGTPWEV
ncbi:MAG: hypothetical protein ACXQS2_05130 [Methermicoccaceae archaeon]